jgi:selenocysteine lyase/cysteine desulfurase
MDRREFFVRGALGAGALALSRCGGSPAAAPSLAASVPAMGGAFAGWRAVRAEFDRLAADRVHMSGFFLVSHPRTVRDAIERHRRGLDDDPFDYVEKNVGILEPAVRQAAAEYLGGAPDDFAMTDSTTQGLGIVYGGLELRAGQEILTTTHDHIVTHLSLEYRARRTGTTVRKVALYDEPSAASVDEIVARLTKAVTPATRIVAVTWVHSGTGVKLPVRAMSDAIARLNAGRDPADRALLFVDGVHGLGNQDFGVRDLGCDFFIGGTHKWIFGPRGTGLVWARPEAWPVTSPIITSFDAMWRPGPPDAMPIAGKMTPGGFHSFEHRWALPAAFDLHRRIGGKARVAARIRELNDRCKQGLAKVRKVRVKTPMSGDLSAGIICFEVDGVTSKDAFARLAAKGIVASVTPEFYVPTYVRLAPSLLTLEEDVDRAVEAVASL